MPSTNSETAKAVIAYVPALHAGYLSFFRNHPGADIYVLGLDFISDFPRLNRDLRALAPHEAAAGLASLGFRAKVLEDTLALGNYHTLVLPDEDVSRDFAQKHLNGKEISLESVFLRWDGVFSNKENEISPDRIITTDILDKDLMQRAFMEAVQSADWWRQIGGLIFKDGEVLTLGHIRHFPSDLSLDIFGTPRITVDFGERPDLYISMHAEADLIAQAASKGLVLRGASIYVTTFPCINCAFLIVRSGISKVYYAKGYSRIDAEGVLKNAGIEIALVADV